MARARNIKPAFFQNEQLAECDPLARLLFAGLWTIADREGRLEDRPKRIKAATLPYDECNADDLLAQLAERGFIQRYCAGASRYILVVNFTKHQHPHVKETASEIPPAVATQKEPKQAEHATSTTQEPGEHRASIVQAEEIPEQARLIPSYLNPLTDSLNLIPESLTTPVGVVAPVVIDNPEPLKDKTAVLIKTTVGEETALQAACRETWGAYSDAYAERYGAAPVRNATVNTQIKQFVQRIGANESPQVAAFYVSNSAAFYVKKMHSVGMLLADAEKLRTEWATNKRVTDTEARQADKTQAIGGVFQELIEESRARNATA